MKMPKLMVLSDSHRASEKIARAAEIYKQGGFDAAVHLGDVFPDARKFAALTGCTPLCVRGNCDGPFADAPDERIETLAGAKLLLAHGDRYGVKSSLTRLSYRAEELGCALALFGHTHRAFCGYVGAALLVNPGALRDGNYAEIALEAGKIVPRLLCLNH